MLPKGCLSLHCLWPVGTGLAPASIYLSILFPEWPPELVLCSHIRDILPGWQWRQSLSTRLGVTLHSLFTGDNTELLGGLQVTMCTRAWADKANAKSHYNFYQIGRQKGKFKIFAYLFVYLLISSICVQNQDLNSGASRWATVLLKNIFILRQ